MRIRSLALAPAALLLVPYLLSGCALPEPAPQAPPTAVAAPAPALKPVAPALSAQEVAQGLNSLINDSEPGSEAETVLRARLTPSRADATLDSALRRVLAQALSFDPPRLRQRWQELNAAQEQAAAQYAATPPQDAGALNGSKVLRRLGPALYLVRLPGGDTALLSAARKRKPGEVLKNIAVQEQLRPKPDAAKGDLVDELQDQPRVFTEISRTEAKRRDAQRAPALARLRGLEAQGDAVERAVALDIARMDALARDVNKVIGPLLLDRASAPAAAAVRKVKRVAKSWNRQQYYRYALPVTGLPGPDAALKAYLDERRAEVQELLKSTGVGKGRLRANVDRIAFTAHAASPRVFSIRFEEFRDTGGAHPNQAFASFSFDRASGARLTLRDLFTDEKAALAVLSELALRRLELVLDGGVFREGLEPRPENFAVFVLDGGDVVFTFPPYQAASYAQGPQTLRVPLFHPRLLPLLSPEFKKALAARS